MLLGSAHPSAHERQTVWPRHVSCVAAPGAPAPKHRALHSNAYEKFTFATSRTIPTRTIQLCSCHTKGGAGQPEVSSGRWPGRALLMQLVVHMKAVDGHHAHKAISKEAHHKAGKRSPSATLLCMHTALPP